MCIIDYYFSSGGCCGLFSLVGFQYRTHFIFEVRNSRKVHMGKERRHGGLKVGGTEWEMGGANIQKITGSMDIYYSYLFLIINKYLYISLYLHMYTYIITVPQLPPYSAPASDLRLTDPQTNWLWEVYHPGIPVTSKLSWVSWTYWHIYPTIYLLPPIMRGGLLWWIICNWYPHRIGMLW